MVSIGVFVRFRVEDGSMGAVEAKKNGEKRALSPPSPPRSTRRVGRGVGERERGKEKRERKKNSVHNIYSIYISHAPTAPEIILSCFMFLRYRPRKDRSHPSPRTAKRQTQTENRPPREGEGDENVTLRGVVVPPIAAEIEHWEGN